LPEAAKREKSLMSNMERFKQEEMSFKQTSTFVYEWERLRKTQLRNEREDKVEKEHSEEI